MIRTRFAPSPTGFLHCGNVRTALFNALMAMHEKGQLVLRIEDSDQTRSTVDLTHIMLADLKWLGLDWQEGPFLQSERQSIYNGYYQTLEAQNLAYPCFCSDETLAIHRKLQISRGEPPRYPGTCAALSDEDILARIQKGQKPAWRFRVAKNQSIEFNDLVKGLQHFDSDVVGDFIIRRADGTSPFLFCNAIDDALMGISHVLRGEDHVANTPRQLMILKALALPSPHYGHLPMILGEAGAPLSKREGSFSVHDLRQQGYLPIAILNYLARLGCTFESNELMSLEELAANFRPDRIGRSPAHFDVNQLRYWQKCAVLQLPTVELQHWLSATIPLNRSIEERDLFFSVMQKNILFPVEASAWSEIIWGGALSFSEEQCTLFRELGKEFFESLRQLLAVETLQRACVILGKQYGVSGKKLYLPVRVALTGRPDGPELIQIAMLLGEKTLLNRINAVLDIIHVKNP